MITFSSSIIVASLRNMDGKAIRAYRLPEFLQRLFVVSGSWMTVPGKACSGRLVPARIELSESWNGHG